MTDAFASFAGGIPENYDAGLGPHIFVDYGADIARRAAAGEPAKVLELAAGTGIVTRLLRDALPAAAELVATDLNPPMLEVAKAKFGDGENVAFRPADATSLPFDDASFDPIKDSLAAAGFTDIAVEKLPLEKEIPDAAVFARGLIQGNPLIEEIRSRGGVEPAAVEAAITEALKP